MSSLNKVQAGPAMRYRGPGETCDKSADLWFDHDMTKIVNIVDRAKPLDKDHGTNDGEDNSDDDYSDDESYYSDEGDSGDMVIKVDEYHITVVEWLNRLSSHIASTVFKHSIGRNLGTVFTRNGRRQCTEDLETSAP